MERTYLEIIFLCGLILQVILLLPHLQDFFPIKYMNYFNKRERLYLLFVCIGFQLLPLIYILSSWFSWFDYNLPKWTGLPALVLYFLGYWLFFRAYTDLGTSWSPGWKIKGEPFLVTTGIFKLVRHPMYSAFAAIAIAQIFLLQNWVVGPAFLIPAIPFYLYRIRREEKQLLLYFGEVYQDYRTHTNALFPEIKHVYFRLIIRKIKHFRRKRLFKNRL